MERNVMFPCAIIEKPLAPEALSFQLWLENSAARFRKSANKVSLRGSDMEEEVNMAKYWQKLQPFLAKEESEALPSVIYHYCPVDALYGIVESRSIWMTHR